MKFVLRDDDLNYFSTPADIERWYTDIFAQGIPVSFSVIPFVKPESDVYTGSASFEKREYPISENHELIVAVNANPLIEIMQHGTTHETVNGDFEYAQAVPLNEALRGREEIERAFAREVSIFVPPHDWIGRDGIFSIEHAGMDIIRGRGTGLRNRIFRPLYVLNFIRMLLFKVRHMSKAQVPAYPFMLSFGKHKEVCSYRLEDRDVFDGLEYAHRENGIFVVVTHLHYYTQEKKELLLRLIKEAQRMNAEFVPAGALFK